MPLTREATASGTSSAEAQLSAAEAQYEQAKLDYQRASTADIAWARSNVNTAQANSDRAQADLNRMQPLVEKEEISRIQYDSYVAAARVAESELQAAKDKLAGATQEADTKKAAMLSRAGPCRAGSRRRQRSAGQSAAGERADGGCRFRRRPTLDRLAPRWKPPS